MEPIGHYRLTTADCPMLLQGGWGRRLIEVYTNMKQHLKFQRLVDRHVWPTTKETAMLVLTGSVLHTAGIKYLMVHKVAVRAVPNSITAALDRRSLAT